MAVSAAGEVRRRLVSIILSSVITVLAISVFYTFYASQRIVESLYSAASRYLDQSAAATERLIRRSSELALQIDTDFQIKRLLYFEELDVLEQVVSLDQLKSYLSILPDVHSIYLYNAKLDTFFAATDLRVQLVQGRDEFYDRFAAEAVADQRIVNHPLPNFRQAPDDAGGIYTFAYSFVGRVDGEPASTIVINVRQTWLQNEFGRSSISPLETMGVIDTSGTLVYGSLESSLELSEAISLVLNRLENAKAGDRANDYFVSGAESTLLISYLIRPDLGWTFVKLTPTDSLLAPLRAFRRVAVAVSLASALLTIGISILLSRRLLVPVRAALSRSDELERGGEELRIAADRQLLHAVLREPDVHSPESIAQILRGRRLGVDIDRPLHIIALSPDLRPGTRAGENPHSLREVVTYLAGSLIPDRDAVVLDFRGNLVAVMIGERDGSSMLREELRVLAQDMVADLARNLGTSFSAAFDPTAIPLAEAARALAGLEGALGYRLIFGAGSCIDMDEVRRRADFVPPGTMIDAVGDALKKDDRAGAEIRVKTIIAQAAASTPRSVRSVSLSLVSVIREAAAQKRGPSVYASYGGVLEDLERCQSVSDVHRLFSDLLDSVTRTQNTPGRAAVIAQATRSAIEEHYADHNLSVIMISEILGLSAPYLGRVFKHETGWSLPEYINRVRVERAKELLDATELGVQAILERTGFNSTSHFHSVFKAQTGSTPSVYRWSNRTSV